MFYRYTIKTDIEGVLKIKEGFEENVNEIKEQLKNALNEQVAKQKEIEKLEK